MTEMQQLSMMLEGFLQPVPYLFANDDRMNGAIYLTTLDKSDALILIMAPLENHVLSW